MTAVRKSTPLGLTTVQGDGSFSQWRLGDMPSLVAQFGKSNALHTKRDGEFATMMEVVGHDAPENPLAREGIVFPLVGKRESLREVGNGPAVERVLDHLPGGLQAFNQFGRLLLDGILRSPGNHQVGIPGAAQTEGAPEPAKTPFADMTRYFTC